MTKGDCELDAERFVIWVSSFVIRASSFFNDAFSQCVKNRGFLLSDFLSDKNKLGAVGLERLQLPAAGHEIEKLRAIAEADETFCPEHARGQAVREALETSARKSLVRSKRERFELELMLYRTIVPDRLGSARCEQSPQSG